MGPSQLESSRARCSALRDPTTSNQAWIVTDHCRECPPADEADVFDSDFGSTDSGGDEDDDEDAGERQLEREAKQAKRVSR